MTTPTYRDQFPDFDPADMPAIPEGFVDRSWAPGGMPSFIHEEAGLVLWVDYLDPAKREHQDGARFTLDRLGTRDPEHGWQFDGNMVELFATDDWDIAAASIPNFIAEGR